MADRLPPEIAALVPNGDQVVVADLTLEQVRVLLVVIAKALRGICRDIGDQGKGGAIAHRCPFCRSVWYTGAPASDNHTPPVHGAVVEGPQG